MVDAAVLGPIGELKAHAVAYAQSGLEVFPLHLDKTPRTTNGMKDATSDPLVVAAWWDQWPDSLIGCRVPADMVVIDVDPKHNGMSTWKLLKETCGPLPVTRSHKSGRNDGGGHLWFRRPPGKLSVRPLTVWAKEHGTGEAAGKHSWTSGVDLLHHDHRYTILPPSPHPVTGAPYRWVESRDLNTQPAEMPTWLVVLVTEEPATVEAREPGPFDERSIADWFSATQSWTDILEDWTLVYGDGDEDGSEWRHPNATTSRSATVRNGCLFVYSSNTDFEVTTDGDPHGYTPFAAYALLYHGDDQRAAARAARQLHDEDWAWTGLDPDVYTCPENRSTPVDMPTDSKKDSPWIIWSDFWKKERVDEEWLIEPLIPRGRQVAIWATHKTGKSLITLEMVAAVAAGQPCLGRGAVPPIRVVYLDLEMTDDDLYERLEDLGYGAEIDMENLYYYLLPSLPPLDTPQGASALREIVERHQPQLVVLDTMARVVAGDENSADTYRAFYRHTGQALKTAGVGVVRLDHGGKAPEQGQRGSSAKGDDVDVVWRLTETESGLLFSREASRIAWIPSQVFVTRELEPLRHVLAARAWPAGTQSLALELDALDLPLDISRQRARQALKEAGIPVRNEVLGKALQYRRMRASDPGGLL